mgnify:CR=1 FL=1
MRATTQRNDGPTIAAIGLLAMCLVTFDHEALGHGGACLALHGRILALSSSVFRCDHISGLIDAAGPASNILCGLVALALRMVTPLRAVRLRLFLILVTGFSFFWEGGYLMHAMHRQDGDLYSFAHWWLGSVSVEDRWIGAALGLALYLLSVRLTARGLLTLFAEPPKARFVARIVWLSAAAGSTLAALVYAGSVAGDLRDAVLEIALASFPLLFIPLRARRSAVDHPAAAIQRSYPAIIFALTVYAVFVATLGHGFA